MDELLLQQGMIGSVSLRVGDTTPHEPSFIAFHEKASLIFEIQRDGNIKLGEGVTLDEASAKIWELVSEFAKQYRATRSLNERAKFEKWYTGKMQLRYPESAPAGLAWDAWQASKDPEHG